MNARLAVVGLGRIGRLHARNLAERGGLVAVVDALEPLARSVGELYGVAWFTSLEHGLAETDADGVVIAAPTGLHAELVELAAGAGRHVFCEKPLGLEVEAGRRAVAAARDAGVRLQVGFQRRFDPDWLALKKALDDRELGALRVLRCSHRNASKAGDALGDLFVDVAVHDLDAARWLGGEVVQVFALACGEAAAIALRFESGALGLVDVSRDARYGFECSAELVGSRATARLGYAHRRGELELLEDGRATAPLPADHAERHEAAYARELEHFAAGRPAHAATGDDAVRALELAALAMRSAELGVPLEADPVAAGSPT